MGRRSSTIRTLAFAFVSLIATALAYSAWFAGLHHLPASTVGLIGLLNPVTGVILGTVLTAEALGPRQAIGIALVLTGILVGQRKQLPRLRATRRPDASTGTAAPQLGRVPLAEPCTIAATSSR